MLTKEQLPLIAHFQYSEFRSPQTVLWLQKAQFSELSLLHNSHCIQDEKYRHSIFVFYNNNSIGVDNYTKAHEWYFTTPYCFDYNTSNCTAFA